ncbi:DUF3231 family protein [Peribacillus frigoritolerans]|uniref:DUF3231 family protein n=1 Tax=Peribacillus frigoritolerans TaxID=450367 RepID=UPI001059B3D7|nr:DUF3231 family protein [Peribacillus frigoritolerans]TDL78008.1 DUF3231 family protein [Peribacillus frigoritolerans]
MNFKNPICSSELGTLWLTYQEKTMILRILEYFMEKSEDQQAKNIMGGLWQELNHFVIKIEDIFEGEGVVIPRGFTKEDVNLEAPKLFDNGFDIMLLRILKEVSMGMYTLNMNMAYREDVMSIYEGLTTVTQKVYKLSTHYLLDKGILTLPPIVDKPKSTEFIEDKNYLSGFSFFKNNRALNDIEIGYLHHGIETNNIGMQLISGFAQCSTDKAVKKYFLKGKKLAKKQIELFEELLMDSDVQFSAGSGGNVTSSAVAPFSQKLMMFCIYLLNGFGLVGSSFGSIFSLRSDLSLKTTLIAKDIYFYANDGIKLMIENGWFEEPPQMNVSNKNKG